MHGVSKNPQLCHNNKNTESLTSLISQGRTKKHFRPYSKINCAEGTLKKSLNGFGFKKNCGQLKTESHNASCQQIPTACTYMCLSVGLKYVGHIFDYHPFAFIFSSIQITQSIKSFKKFTAADVLKNTYSALSTGTEQSPAPNSTSQVTETGTERETGWTLTQPPLAFRITPVFLLHSHLSHPTHRASRCRWTPETTTVSWTRPGADHPHGGSGPARRALLRPRRLQRPKSRL